MAQERETPPDESPKTPLEAPGTDAPPEAAGSPADLPDGEDTALPEPEPAAPATAGDLPTEPEASVESGAEAEAAPGAEPATEAASEATVDASSDSDGPATPDDAPEEGASAEDATTKTAEPAARPARRRRKKDVPPVPPERLEGAVEALLVAAGDVLTAERLRDLLGLTSVVHVREAVEAIRARWAEAALPVEIQDVAGGLRVVTRPEYAEYVHRLSRRPDTDRLSPSLMETLSIVAYRQPVPRVEVERIRGVQCGEALRALLERRLLKVTGRSDQPGRPLLYGTTRRFLEVFGLHSLKDLPAKGDLGRL